MMKADENKNLISDIKKEAIQTIFKYINGYKKYCLDKIRPNLYYFGFEGYNPVETECSELKWCRRCRTNFNAIVFIQNT